MSKLNHCVQYPMPTQLAPQIQLWCWQCAPYKRLYYYYYYWTTQHFLRNVCVVAITLSLHSR